MIAFLSLLVTVLPWITSLLTIIGAANGVNAGTVISYGGSVNLSSIWATIIPLGLAGLTKLGTMVSKQQLQALIDLGSKRLGLSDASTSYVFDAIDVGRIAVYAKLYSEATTNEERDKISESANVAIDELRDRLFPDVPLHEVKGGA